MTIVYGLSSSEDFKIRYIGQTKSKPESRRKSHIFESLHEKNSQTYKCRWVRKVLSDGFQIRITVLKENAIYNVDEIVFIKQYKSMGADLVNGTDGGNHAFDTSPEAKKKMSERKKGKPLSEETKAKLSAIRKGRKQTPEWIAKRVEARKAKNNFSHSEETKEKISDFLRGRALSQETRNKLKISQKLTWEKRKAAWVADGHTEPLSQRKKYST